MDSRMGISMREHDCQCVALSIVVDHDALDRPIVRQRPLRKNEHLRREQNLLADDVAAGRIVRVW